MLKPYVTAKFNRGVKNRRLPAFVETIRISQQGYAVLTKSCISFSLSETGYNTSLTIINL